MQTITTETLFAALTSAAQAEYTAQAADAEAQHCVPAYDLDSVVKGVSRDLARAARSAADRARVIAEAQQCVRNAASRTPATADTKRYPALDDAMFSLRAAAVLLALAK